MTVGRPRLFFVIAAAVTIGAIISFGGAVRQAPKPFGGSSSVRFITIGDTGRAIKISLVSRERGWPFSEGKNE
jgi:hypothetical protein